MNDLLLLVCAQMQARMADPEVSSNHPSCGIQSQWSDAAWCFNKVQARMADPEVSSNNTEYQKLVRAVSDIQASLVGRVVGALVACLSVRC